MEQMKYSFLLYSLFVKQVFGDNNSVIPDGYSYTQDGCIHGNNLKLVTDVSEEDCAIECNENNECEAFEYFNGGNPGDPIVGHVMTLRDCYLQSDTDSEGCDGGPYNVDLYVAEPETATEPETAVEPETATESETEVTWTVDMEYHCGGDNINPLEDGTAYGWIPSNEGKTVETCKTKCVESPSCTSFVWRDSDSACFWKTNTSPLGTPGTTVFPRPGHDCYSYKVSTIGGGAFGDPHFKTWNGKQFDFHGVCDLVLVSNLEFGNGIGLDVHIRTRKTRQWSYVDSAAARIGDDILEVRGGKNNTFWINGVQGNINTDEMVVANYKIKYQNISEKSKKFVVDLGDGEGIIFKTWNSFVSVQIENPKHENFVGSVGLMGSFPKGLKIDRTNSIVEDFDVFGKEWQVLSTEQKLFHNIEDPQHPQKCEIPSSVEMRRRLAVSLVTFGEAEKACVGADSDNKELCIFDIMATNDLSSAGVY